MRDSSELFDLAIKAIGAKRVSRAMCLSLSQTYRLARHVFDDDNLDGTGARNDLDRIEQLVEAMAARPSARPALVEWRLWMEQLFSSALDRSQGSPVTLQQLRTKATNALRETADIVDACNDASDICRDRIASEALQARDLLDRILSALEHEVSP